LSQSFKIDKAKISTPSKCNFISRKNFAPVKDNAHEAAVFSASPGDTVKAHETWGHGIYCVIASNLNMLTRMELSAALADNYVTWDDRFVRELFDA